MPQLVPNLPEAQQDTPPAIPNDHAIRQVLVVDDSRLQRKILVSSLKKWGFETVEASSGDQALEICRRTPPDLVLSDWMMPGMTGIEFCREFRRMARDSYGYFILLTSKSEKDEIASGLDAGADDFLTKPVNAGELRARISAGARIVGMARSRWCRAARVMRKTVCWAPRWTSCARFTIRSTRI
ncbi:MAG: response regulator [Roseovarius sp.]